MRLSLFLLVVATAPSVFSQSRSLTTEIFPEIEKLYQLADEDSTAAQLRSLNEREASYLSKIDHAPLWPKLEASSNFSYRVEDRADFDYLVEHTDYNSTATLSYPLYHWGALRAQAKQGRETLRQASIKNEMDLLDQHAKIRALYWQLLIAQKRLSITREEMQALLNQTPGEEISPIAEESRTLDRTERQLTLQELEGKVDALAGELQKLLGSRPELSFSFAGFPEALSIPETWDAESLRSTLETKKYESRAAEKKAEITRSKALGLPRIDLVGAFYQDLVDGVNVSSSVQRNNYLIGIRGRWELFNGWKTSSEVALSRIRHRRESEYAKETIRQAREKLELDLRELKILEARYQIARARLKLNEAQLSSQTELSKQGQVSNEAIQAMQRNRAAVEIAALESLTRFLDLYEKIQNIFALPENA